MLMYNICDSAQLESVQVSTQSCLTLRRHGLQPSRLLCPWDSPGKNALMGCHFLFQGIFWTQGSNPSLLCLLHWEEDALPLYLGGKSLKYACLGISEMNANKNAKDRGRF